MHSTDGASDFFVGVPTRTLFTADSAGYTDYFLRADTSIDPYNAPCLNEELKIMNYN